MTPALRTSSLFLVMDELAEPAKETLTSVPRDTPATQYRPSVLIADARPKLLAQWIEMLQPTCRVKVAHDATSIERTLTTGPFDVLVAGGAELLVQLAARLP